MSSAFNRAGQIAFLVRDDDASEESPLNADGSALGRAPLLFLQLGKWRTPHIHVESADATAKYWLDPVELARSRGFRARDLTRLRAEIIEHQSQLLEAWMPILADRISAQAMSVAFAGASIRVV